MLPPPHRRLLAGIGHRSRRSAAVPLCVVGAELHGGPREQEQHDEDKKHHVSTVGRGELSHEWQERRTSTRSCHAATRDYPGLPCHSPSASSGCPTSASRRCSTR